MWYYRLKLGKGQASSILILVGYFQYFLVIRKMPKTAILKKIAVPTLQIGRGLSPFPI